MSHDDRQNIYHCFRRLAIGNIITYALQTKASQAIVYNTNAAFSITMGEI